MKRFLARLAFDGIKYEIPPRLQEAIGFYYTVHVMQYNASLLETKTVNNRAASPSPNPITS